MASASGAMEDSSLANGSMDFSTSEFARIIGLVEDTFVGEEFQTRHNRYCTDNCQKFKEDDENQPLSSTELEKLTKERFNIFRTYSIEMAAFLESELRQSLGQDFEIQGFMQEIELRSQRLESTMAQEKAASGGESVPSSPRGRPPSPPMDPDINGEIFEMLLTFKDYGRFQELMVDYSKMTQGKTPNMDGLVSLRRISEDDIARI